MAIKLAKPSLTRNALERVGSKLASLTKSNTLSNDSLKALDLEAIFLKDSFHHPLSQNGAFYGIVDINTLYLHKHPNCNQIHLAIAWVLDDDLPYMV